MDDDLPEDANIPVLKTHVYFEDKVFFVSTINRSYGGYLGRGLETLAWELDKATLTKGKWIFQGSGFNEHFDVCRQLANDGKIKEKDND